MYFWVLLLASVLFSLTACGEASESYPPPPQRQVPVSSERDGLGHFIRMNAPNADLYIVRDIAPVVESGTWRWALQHPELRFFLEQTAGLRFSLDLAVPEITFRHTGPVTISIRINGHPFQEVHCDEPGSRQFVWPVPSSLLMAGAINTVLFQPDKVWASPEDGTALGFILTEAGFLQ